MTKRRRTPARVLRSMGQRFFASQSDFAREVIRAPGSWRCLDRLYRNAPTSAVDRWVLNLRACEETRARLAVYRTLLANAVARAPEDPVRLLDLGSGPGWAPLDVAVASPRRVLVTCVDRAADALEAGRALARAHGLDGAVTFRRADLRQAPDRLAPAQFDVIGTHGVLDYFSDDESVALLARLRDLLSPGGRLVTSNMTPHDDGVARFLMEFFGGWRLQYREASVLRRMLAAAGYGAVTLHTTPHRFHALAVATVPA